MANLKTRFPFFVIILLVLIDSSIFFLMIDPVEGENINRKKNQNSYSKNTNEQFLYRVQIGVFKNDVPVNIVKIILERKDVYKETDVNGIKYQVGNFPTKEEADKFKKELIMQGIKDAFIVLLPTTKKISTIKNNIVKPKPPKNNHQKEEIINYRVRSGDTINLIAKKFGMTNKELMELNDFNSPEIKILQIIKVRQGF